MVNIQNSVEYCESYDSRIPLLPEESCIHMKKIIDCEVVGPKQQLTGGLLFVFPIPSY